MSESEIQELRMPVAGEFFYNICHSRTQIINEILSKLKYRRDERPPQAKFCCVICHSRLEIFNILGPQGGVNHPLRVFNSGSSTETGGMWTSPGICANPCIEMTEADKLLAGTAVTFEHYCNQYIFFISSC